MVYTLLHEHGMDNYYKYEQTPGISQQKIINTPYDYLENSEIINKLLSFNEGNISKVTFYTPQIHCSSCLWLLEHLSMLDAAVIKSNVNFVQKKVSITFNNKNINLRGIAELLTRIGYKPQIHFDSLDNPNPKSSFDKKLIYKLGLAGFCFGNIMLLSFPEYLGFDKASFLFHIGYINIILAIPVLLYSGIDYLKSAFKGILLNDFNIDLPIALGMIALFTRSVYEIISHSGEGYLDSFAGFVYFLLIGRWFQAITYRSLDFDRNYKSYFPISANVLQTEKWVSRSIDQLIPGNIIRIRNMELIPADGILHKGNARIDYSFVTGESNLLSKKIGDELYAGGRHQGESIELIVTKKVDQSYLTQLWNEDTFKNENISTSGKLISVISKYFTYIIISIAILTIAYWMQIDTSLAFKTFTAVLIVACPCALALSIPFTYGNVLRLLSHQSFYLRNVETIEHIQDIDYIIFDKTGTITDSNKIEVTYSGKQLTSSLRSIIKSTCSHSSHPLSQAIVNSLEDDHIIDISRYQDYIGKGFTARCDGYKVKVGSSSFIFNAQENENGVFIEINGEYLGCFKFEHALRDNIKSVMSKLRSQYKIGLLSGDTSHERARFKKLMGADAEIYFNQKPKDKLEKIKSLQDKGYHVMMIGDGLNDAGALKQANVGIVISDDTNNFSPACDGIIGASLFYDLYNQFTFIKKSKYIIYGAFLLAFIYNTIGLYFAISGQLSPVIAAILMPLSSITVIIYGVISSYILFHFITKKKISLEEN